MKKYIDFIISIITLLIEMGFMVYGLFNGFTLFLESISLVVAIIGFGIAYICNRKFNVKYNDYKDYYGHQR